AAQVAAFLLAGQDSPANTLALGLRALARLLEFQAALRAEISARAESVAYDSMPLLNSFIKEMLRMYPALPIDDRIAVEDKTIPLSEAITTTTGEAISQIRIQKGQIISMAIAAFQRVESRWGEDAHEFNPNRWLHGSAYQGEGEALAPYANL
ncbi:cytochrome P450, partial [Mycena alexandri]